MNYGGVHISEILHVYENVDISVPLTVSFFADVN